MSVNGIEIKVGQKWVTGDGRVLDVIKLKSNGNFVLGDDDECTWYYNEDGELLGSETLQEYKLITLEGFSESVFKEGDVVYTTRHNKGVVQLADDRSVVVKHEDVNIQMHYQPKEVSFSPWQAPNHKRPPEDGYWIFKEEPYVDHYILKVVEGKLYCQTGEYISNRTQERMTLVKYLGKEIT